MIKNDKIFAVKEFFSKFLTKNFDNGSKIYQSYAISHKKETL